MEVGVIGPAIIVLLCLSLHNESAPMELWKWNYTASVTFYHDPTWAIPINDYLQTEVGCDNASNDFINTSLWDWSYTHSEDKRDSWLLYFLIVKNLCIELINDKI